MDKLNALFWNWWEKYSAKNLKEKKTYSPILQLDVQRRIPGRDAVHQRAHLPYRLLTR